MAVLMRYAYVIAFEVLLACAPLLVLERQPRNGNVMGLLILMLFVYYPLVALGTGILSWKLVKNPWFSSVVTICLFILVMLWKFNSSAFVYIPFYVVFSIIGSLLARNRGL